MMGTPSRRERRCGNESGTFHCTYIVCVLFLSFVATLLTLPLLQVEAMRRGENIAGGGNTNPTGKMGNALIVGEEKAEGGEGKFDYELMYRTYMRIPEDER